MAQVFKVGVVAGLLALVGGCSLKKDELAGTNQQRQATANVDSSARDERDAATPSDTAHQGNAAFQEHTATSANATQSAVASAQQGDAASQMTASPAHSQVTPSAETTEPVAPNEQGLCFSNLRNGALAGLIPGCACNAERDAGFETCVGIGSDGYYVSCRDGAWRSERIDADAGSLSDLCQRSCVPSLPYLEKDASGNYPRHVYGDVVCVGSCPYRYSDIANSNNDDYFYAAELVCPQATEDACDWLGKQLEVDAPCETDGDCNLLLGELNTCDGPYQDGLYFSSNLLSASVRAKRDVLAQHYRAAGCGKFGFQNDGSAFRVACIQGTCGTKLWERCGP